VTADLPEAWRIALPEGLPRAWFDMAPVGGADLIARVAHEQGWSSFERPLPELFLACARRWPGLVVDVGSNTGFYALTALCAHEDNRVLAYEPDPQVLPILKWNGFLNRCGERLRVEPVALSDRQGIAELYIPLQGHGLVESSSSLEAGFKGAHSSVVRVAASTLDQHLGLTTPVSLIKVDVEGHEKSTVTGAEGVLAAQRPLLFVELLDYPDYGYFNGLKGRLNYRAVRLRETHAVEEEVIARDRSAWNHVLVPEERWGDFRALLTGLGLA
jgi:FkbM family methyltransferase